jgi:hypothetical protein
VNTRGPLEWCLLLIEISCSVFMGADTLPFIDTGIHHVCHVDVSHGEGE